MCGLNGSIAIYEERDEGHYPFAKNLFFSGFVPFEGLVQAKGLRLSNLTFKRRFSPSFPLRLAYSFLVASFVCGAAWLHLTFLA